MGYGGPVARPPIPACPLLTSLPLPALYRGHEPLRGDCVLAFLYGLGFTTTVLLDIGVLVLGHHLVDATFWDVSLALVLAVLVDDLGDFGLTLSGTLLLGCFALGAGLPGLRLLLPTWSS